MVHVRDISQSLIHQAIADVYNDIKDQADAIYAAMDKILNPLVNTVRLEHLLRKALPGKTDMVALILFRATMLWANE